MLDYLPSTWLGWALVLIAAINVTGLPLAFHIRLLLTVAWQFRNGRIPDVLEGVRLPLRVWPSECDINLHMNNASYNLVADMGRYAFAVGTGMWAKSRADGFYLANGGVSLRFKRELKPLAAYTHITRLHSFDGKWMYLEHRFEAPNSGKVHAFGYSRFVAKKGRDDVPPATLLRELGYADAVDVVSALTASKAPHASLGALADSIDDALYDVAGRWSR
ncbi:thioesterase superfamily protein [Thecamonas trahens ATCC 50062]|uniref:Thioesterase superfamily protein n=1 Tax=Thecamonas trahens ATCC 50062 TaxID=461836 RepID=A0A0L0DEL2_THETB|nr:thioesterase superfamily protein [Thecamonas trahens ATCC 50062]KNC50655.1 thioesterase superfamily protein [Thecamonas trahens ATCC 50062]|eukprot:XP_013762535.1 thioesterase superfamily protein [Thecamonas trahens ATCC 50062]